MYHGYSKILNASEAITYVWKFAQNFNSVSDKELWKLMS